MAFGPITLWQIDGETMETVTDFILGGSKITADGVCSHVKLSCSFTFVKRLFSSSSLHAIRVMSSAYLKLLIFRAQEGLEELSHIEVQEGWR